MARRVVLTDDFDNTESDNVRTHFFMLNHAYREIDLTDANWAKLLKLMKPFFDKSRETTFNRVRANAPVQEKEGDENLNAKIRTWARANGWPDLGERGRIPEDAVEKYNAAMEKAE